MNKYDHQAIEKKWQSEWAKTEIYKTSESPRKKYYALDMFPYPSGAGLHVGHPRGYIASDVYARMKRAQGYDVLHTMGWDSFGLPAENYAIKTGTPPLETTNASIDRYRKQLSSIGLSYDWSREVAAHDPKYYRWTQWLFLKLYERGLAYQKEAPVNWCPKDQTVLANEQVIDGKCDRCGSNVIQRNLKQWFFKITQYADELLSSLDDLDWPDSTKAMQRNWIGKSEGVDVDFKIENSESLLTIFTTRVDTIYAGTFLVLAPEHPLVDALTTAENRTDMESYKAQSALKSQRDRMIQTNSQSGVFTGSYAVNPVNGNRMQIWVSDFVIGSYGHGAVFADAHDERDFALAKKYGIDLISVLVPTDDTNKHAVANLEICYTGDGILTNSDQFDGLTSSEARNAIAQWLSEKDAGRVTTTYRIRDWLVSRQRYWGAPIPIIHCDNCGAVPVPEDQLPVLLPTDVDFLPTGESPITRSESFHKGVTCPKCGQAARRESDTLDTFVDSSWYFLRFTDPHNSEEAFDAAKANQWLPVDAYVGGAEHTVLHLLYSRFMTKALADMGLLIAREPFQLLRHQGMIIAEDGRKMSKSLGNVINPDELQEKYGTDTLRAYEMFMGPFAESMPWSTRSMIGVRRWLDRVWQLQDKVIESNIDTPDVRARTEQTVKKVSDDIEAFKFNTCISALMELTNLLKDQPAISRPLFHRLLQLIAPFAPHLAEELYELTDGDGNLQLVAWPVADPALLVVDEITLPVQINGKLRGTLQVSPTLEEATVLEEAKSDSAIARYLVHQDIDKVIYIQGKVLNLVTNRKS